MTFAGNARMVMASARKSESRMKSGVFNSTTVSDLSNVSAVAVAGPLVLAEKMPQRLQILILQCRQPPLRLNHKRSLEIFLCRVNPPKLAIVAGKIETNKSLFGESPHSFVQNLLSRLDRNRASSGEGVK